MRVTISIVRPTIKEVNIDSATENIIITFNKRSTPTSTTATPTNKQLHGCQLALMA